MNETSPTRAHETVGRLSRWQERLGLRRPESASPHSDVQLVEAPTRTFADETAILLRSRLRVYSLVSLVVLGGYFALSLLVDPLPLLVLRALVLAVIGGCYASVRSPRTFSTERLRRIELTVLFAAVVQLVVMMTARMTHFAALGDPLLVTIVQQGYMAGWVLLVLSYGLFIPVPWQRAAMLLIPLGLAPLVLIEVLAWRHDNIAGIVAREWTFGSPALPLVAAIVAVVSARTIHCIREAAFAGQRFGQYVLVERIGGGGMGEVYRAEHLLLKRPCAVKLIRADRTLDEETITRFEAEVRATARLSHPNTVEIYDFGRARDGTLYYVMELLRGLNFDVLVKQHGPLLPERVVYLLRQVCGALGEAHAAGLVHRDIKPSNIFAAERGGVYDFAKLLDFGLVRDSSSNGDPDNDSVGGSPHYMAPEQFSNYGAVDPRSDLYAVGAVGYFLLIGRPPFAGQRVKELRDAHLHQPPTPPSELRPSVPRDLESVLLRCLAKSPEERYSSAEGLRTALDGCACAELWTDESARCWWQEHPCGVTPAKAEMIETVT
jgi:serine/threonine-protein kinase